jgi:hypothetical protein
VVGRGRWWKRGAVGEDYGQGGCRVEENKGVGTYLAGVCGPELSRGEFIDAPLGGSV